MLMAVLCKAAKHVEPSGTPPNPFQIQVTAVVGPVAAAHSTGNAAIWRPGGLLGHTLALLG